MNSLGAILLAAGGSSRLGRCKQLLDIDGEPLVRRQAQLLLEQDYACVVVITGAEQHAVRDALDGLPSIRLVHNSDWKRGMGLSLAFGIRSMPERVRGALLLLCDQWKISADDLSALSAAWLKKPGSVATAQWQGDKGKPVAGPPVVFPRELFPSLLKLQGDRGAHSIVKRFKGGVEHVEVPNAAFDIDEESDLP
jgi:molybdenum cofactor cytidylyltransferase